MNFKYYTVIFLLIIIFFLFKSHNKEHFGTDTFHRSILRDRVRQYDLLSNRRFLYPNHYAFWKNCNCTEKCPNNQWICKSHEYRFNPKNIQ